MAKKSKANDLVWANEVMEVYQNLGTQPGSRNWSSSSVSHLFDWAMREDNETKFLTAMVPKATDILAKHGLADVTEAVVAIDTKTIADLSLILASALKASEKKQEPRPQQVEPESEPTSEISLEDILS